MPVLFTIIGNVAAVIVASVVFLSSFNPALAFCVRNDTGAPIRVEAGDGTATFRADIANNEKACCRPADERCKIGQANVSLSINTSEGNASCNVTVVPKGNVNITGNRNALKCKANKPGSTMDWASD